MSLGDRLDKVVAKIGPARQAVLDAHLAICMLKAST